MNWRWLPCIPVRQGSETSRVTGLDAGEDGAGCCVAVVHGNMVAVATDAGAARQGTRRWWVAVLAVIVAGLAAGWVLLGRGSDGGVARRTPGELTFAQEDFDGDRVRTVGVVRRFGPEDGATRLHFVVEDEDQNRVGLIGGDPARHVGRTVLVVGTFRFAPDVGRWIEVERLEDR